jgi:hypothetical protein
MLVKASAGRVTLEERDNFRAFKLVAEDPRHDIEMIRHVLAGAAELPDADTAWVFESWLRGYPDVAQDAAWQQSLSAMIEKARPHGWIDDTRKAIKAHVEWVG